MRAARELDLQGITEVAAFDHGVPGAAVCLVSEDRAESVYLGVGSYQSNRSINADTLFQIGSSAKMLTAALVGVAVDRGQLQLHQPIARLLPGVRPDPSITVFHLLTHTAGFDGDMFIDTGEGVDAIAAYVERIAAIPQADPPGRRHSYCNAGFSILARLCELVFEMSWDEAMTRFIAHPCGMEGFVGGPHAMPAGAAFAFGHVPGPDGKLQPIPLTRHRFLSPAGGGPMATLKDMVGFADMMMRHGLTETGNRVLSAGWTGLMKTRWIDGPASTFASAWGLGTMIYDWSRGRVLYGHDGVVPGQNFFLRIDSSSQSYAVIMTNGGFSDGFADQVFRQALAPVVGAEPLMLPKLVDLKPHVLERFAGVYCGPSARIRVEPRDTGLGLECFLPETDIGPSTILETELVAIGSDLFLAEFPNRSSPLMQRFQDFDQHGRPHVLNFRGRAFHRVSNGEADR